MFIYNLCFNNIFVSFLFIWMCTGRKPVWKNNTFRSLNAHEKKTTLGANGLINIYAFLRLNPGYSYPRLAYCLLDQHTTILLLLSSGGCGIKVL